MCSLFFLMSLAIGLSISFNLFENISIDFIDLFYCLQFLLYFISLFFQKKKNEPWFHLSFPLFGHFCSILFISTLIFITSFLLLLWCLGSVCSSLSSFFSYKDRLFIWDFCCCCFLRQACINISTLYMILLFTIFQCSMDLK